MAANSVNPEHAHEFDARLLVIEGAMTINAEGHERTYRAGDSFAMTAGCRHTEQSGPEGARYLGFIFSRAETPAAAEAALREAHRHLRFVIH